MLDEVLINWPSWGLPISHYPDVVGELQGGRTNRTFLCKADSFQFVVRLNSPISQQLNICREHEKVILEQVGKLGIAPITYFADTEEGILVSEYLEGVCWTKAQFQDPHNQPRIAALLDSIHAQQVELPDFDYFQHAEHYWQVLLKSGKNISEKLVQYRLEMLPLLEQLQAQSIERVLCHHDLVPANIIECNDELKLLDWEYAGMGIAGFDLAVARAEGAYLPQVDESGTNLPQQAYQYISTLWEFISE